MDLPFGLRNAFSRSTSNISLPATLDEGPIPSSAIDDLQSTAQRELMDAIDRLRSQLSRELDLPQLVVCGNQSAGKSSVLEAIARVAFPSGQETTTRFATEIILRRAAQSRTAVSIQPAPETSSEEEQRLRQFSAELTSLEHVPDVVAEAQEYVLEGAPARLNFCEHRLRVEVSGPNQPHLTLVDLPGLIATTNSAATAGDIRIIEELNKFYMRQPRSIILAVMSAQNDYLTQPIFRLAREVDPMGHRTMGILTKPDLVEQGTEEPRIRLARNEGDAVLDLGWHVLRNRTRQLENASSDRRDDEEAHFFSEASAWSDLPADLRGIRSLRQKLSNVLFNTITMSLPEITHEIETKLRACSHNLEKLGEPRPEASQQRYFLTDVATKLCSLVTQALNGHYQDAFFSNGSSEVRHAKRLGTKLATIGEKFALTMDFSGERFHIVEDGTQTCPTHSSSVNQTRFELSSDEHPQCVTRSAALEAASAYVRQNKSRGLPGDAPANGDADLFKVQSLRWEDIAHNYADQCVQAVAEFFQLALHHVAPEHTAAMIMTHIARSKMTDSRAKSRQKIHELVSPFRKSFITTQNPGYRIKNSQYEASSTNEENGRPQITSVVFKSDSTAAEAILNKVKTYYPIALYTFIDNVVSLAVENCVVEPLKSIFQAKEVSTMDDDRLALIGSEPPRVVHERERDLRRLTVLQEVLDVCNRTGEQY
ncbi:hypothetical protein PRZ48_009664 [Zasmidium cellare]|uniref:Uncharacterized protein n=1 Tax=Zasmidium cellare TaxID=395010 RepID=A0ABR0ECF9_ZASCE|nr:hypothetical protein PRZ48_009664 [Zasmidium cellare]